MPAPAARSQPATTSSNKLVSDSTAQATISKEYRIKGAGVLRLAVPITWASRPRRIPEGREVIDAIEFAPFTGVDFLIHLELRNLGPGVTKSFDIHASLIQAANAELDDSVEKSVDIHDINGPEVTGGYYSVTDKRYVTAQPNPGEFKYLTQGFAKLGTMLLKFRLLSNQPPGEEKDQLVEMIRSAQFSKE